MSRLLRTTLTVGLSAALVLGAGCLPANAEPAVPDLSDARVAAAYSTAPCDPAGPSATDGSVATQLNGRLSGSLRNAMTAYRVSCARQVVQAVKQRGLGERAAVIAITTTIVESTLQNIDQMVDHTSLGLFQQQNNWGTRDQRLNPVWATNKFLDKMVQLYPGNAWAGRPIGEVCQAVQVSAYPERYQPQAGDAQIIVDALWNAADGGGAAGSDINGDGRADTVALYNDGQAMWYPNHGTTRDKVSFLSARKIFDAPGFKLMGTGDIDANGRADIVAVTDDGEARWYPSNGGGYDQANFLSARKIFNAGGIKILSVGDIDSNGRADIVAVLNDGNAVWYPNNGTTAGETKFLSARPIFHAGGFKLMSIGDIDADGRPDIVAVTNDGEARWYPNNGGSFASINFLSARKIFNAGGIRLMSTGDIDADGEADILAVTNDNDLRWYPNNGTNRNTANFLSARHIDIAPAFHHMSN